MPRSRGIPTAVVALFALAVAGCGSGSARGAKAEAYCRDVLQEGCVRAWDCIPPGQQSAAFTGQYGTSLEQCLSFPNDCAKYPAACPGFDPDAGATCLSEFTNDPCGQVLILDTNGDPTIALPTLCGAVCP